MNKKTKVVLGVVVCLLIVGVVAYILTQRMQDGGRKKEPSVTVDVETADETLDLTAYGNVDWIHIAGQDQVNRKNIETQVIGFKSLSSKDIATVDGTSVNYVWTDGAPNEISRSASLQALTTAGTFKATGAPGDVTADAGYEITIPAADETRYLTFVSGILQATAKLTITTNDDAEPVYTTELTSVDKAAVVNKYTVTIQEGNAVTITTKITHIFTTRGNVSLGGIALGTTLDAALVEVRGPESVPDQSMDLTMIGDLDWVHLADDINRKSNVAEQIKVENLGNYPMRTLKDAPISYSWTDGTVNSVRTDSTRSGTFTYRHGDVYSVDFEIQEQAGYRITIPTADIDRELTFVSGVWRADVHILIKRGGDEKPLYEDKNWQCVGTSVVNNVYKVLIEAGESLVVETTYIKKHSPSSNINLQAITLSSNITMRASEPVAQE